MKTVNKAKVSAVRVDEYDSARLHSAVEMSIDLIGGLDRIVKPDSRVFVKINHLSPPSPAEKGIVTHPVLVEAVLELLKRSGATIVVGDDIDSSFGDGFQISGFRQMCERAGVRLINLRQAGFVETGCQGHFLKKVYVSSSVLDADVIINLPKLKTHSLTILTGGVKNMFGTIPHGLRTRFHSEYRRNEDFSQVLADIFSVTRPQLTIMDGIVAMEGDGPATGSLRKLGVIFASEDAVAVDAVAARIVGFDPLHILTTRHCDERGLGVGDIHNIEVVGEKLENLAVRGFEPPTSATAMLTRNVPGFLYRLLQRQLSVGPRVQKSQCTACLECERICPAAAIAQDGNTVRINRGVCIQCMCCHEVCRFDAIKLRRGIAGRIIYSLVSTLFGV